MGGLLSANAGLPPLPYEIPTFSSLTEEVRTVVAQRMRDIRKTYRLKEVQPGKYWYLDEAATPVLELTWNCTVGEGSKTTQELLQIRNLGSSPRDLYTEKTFVEGVSLKCPDGYKRASVDGTADYSIRSGEKRKTVSIFFSQLEAFRWSGDYSESATTGRVYRYNLIYGGTPLLRMMDAQTESERNLTYQTVASAYSMKVDNFGWNVNGMAQGNLRVQLKTNGPNSLGQIRYFLDGAEVFGLNAFLKKFNETIYADYFSDYGAVEITRQWVNNFFPTAGGQQSIFVGSNTRFLNDLIVLRSQVDQARSTPALLNTLSARLTQIITSIQEGTLVIGSDTRPKE